MPESEDPARAHPGAFPFILVDKVLASAPDERAIGLRNVTANDPLLAAQGRREVSLRRGLIVEAFSQLAAVALAPKGTPPQAVEISRIDSMRFVRSPVPGDQLVLTIELSKPEAGEVSISCKAEVDGSLIAEGTLVASR
jgi:3-hydroxyacyl-[acyl-carrier-protein] dehydratase